MDQGTAWPSDPAPSGWLSSHHGSDTDRSTRSSSSSSIPRANSSSPDCSPPYCRPRINSTGILNTHPGVLKSSSSGIPSSPHASAPSSPCPARPDLMVPLTSIHDNRKIEFGMPSPGNGLFDPTNPLFESYIPQEFVELWTHPLPQYLRDIQPLGPDWVNYLTLSSLHVSPMTLQTIKNALEHDRLKQLYWGLKNITNLSLRESTPFGHESERLSMAFVWNRDLTQVHRDAISSRKVRTSDLKTRVKSCLGYMLDVNAQEVPHWDLDILRLLDPTMVDEQDLLNAVTQYMDTLSADAQPRMGRRIDDLLTRCDESGRAECVDARIHQLIAVMKAALKGSRGLIVWK
ncbi:hypothetical protein C8J56DRAFT_903975 [Mycena floridula]|nr:hypothetical protein C8J56DRAFT_903975 [Mycena floridula]